MEVETKQYHKKGLWTEKEDRVLLQHIKLHGIGHWNRIPILTGLKRCGKSCRLRWLNYLSPNVKRGCFSEEEEDLIIRLHKLIGNRWALIAGRVPGRTDNQVKNHWNTHLSKKLGITKKQSRKVLVLSKKKSVAINGDPNVSDQLISTTHIEQVWQNCETVAADKEEDQSEQVRESVKNNNNISAESPKIHEDLDLSDIILDGFCIPELDDHQMYWHYF